MSYTFLQAAGAESSAESFSAIPASVLSSLNLTAGKFCSNASATESCRRSQSGTTSRRSTANLGATSLTLSPAASHARASASPVPARDLTTKKADSGANRPESLATYDRRSCSWKTRQHSLFAADFESLATLPRWGMTVAGELFLLPTPFGLTAFRASIMSVLESGSLVRMETPCSTDAIDRTPSKNFIITKTGRARHVNKDGIQSQERLSQQVKRLPTPTVDGNYNRKGASKTSGDGLATAVKTLRAPTPRSADGEHSSGAHQGKPDTLPSFVKTLTQRVPTPKASEAGPDFAKLERSSTGISLPTWVALKRVPTPTTQDAKNNGNPSSLLRDNLNGTVGGPLNPEWVEWLMGWPIGWTGLQPLAMDKFQQWLNSHSTL